MSLHWIYPLECEFCQTKLELFHIDITGTMKDYTACMSCIKKKGWDK